MNSHTLMYQSTNQPTLTKMTPRSERTSAFEKVIEQEWSEYYFKFMTSHDGSLFYVYPVNISRNINISLQTILNHPEYEWSLEGISINPNLTWEFVKTYKDGAILLDDELLWEYRLHSLHYARDYENNEDMREIVDPPTSMKMMPDYSIDDIMLIVPISPGGSSIANMLRSKKIFPHHLMLHPEVEWNYTIFASTNPNMTVADFKHFIELGHIKSWRKSLASFNSAFDVEDIVKTPELEWDYEGVGVNSKLRFQFILDNHTINGKEYLSYVDENEFVVEKAAFLERRRREYLAAYRIQQWWWRVTSHPDNMVCKRRLERDYAEMFQVTQNLLL